MNTLAVAALILTNITFAALAWYARREWGKALKQNDALTAHITQVRKLAYDDGFTSGLRRGLGDMYKAVRKAERDGRDVSEAAAAVQRVYDTV